MSQAVNTGSTLTYPNGTNKTSTSISTNILILVGNTPVGAVQRLTITESREIKMIDEIGTDGHVDSVPIRSTNVSGNCERIRLDRMRVAEAFSRGFIHVKSQAYPFDIVVLDRQKSDTASQISTVIKNVWIKSINTDYSATDWVISDRMEWEAETIYSVLSGGGSNPVAQGGERGVNFSNIQIERLTDTGTADRRGSLDASGLIDLGTGITLF